MASRSIPARLHMARVFLTNATKSQTLLDRVAPFGYTQAVLHNQLAKNKLAAAAYAAKGDALALQQAAAELAKTGYAESRVAYDHLRGIALLVFCGPLKEYRVSLRINRKPPRTIAGYILAAQTFYYVAQNNATIAQKLAAVGVTAEQFEQAHNLVDQYSLFCSEHRDLIGASRQATQHLRAAMKEHDEWFLQFRRTAKHIIRDQPDLFESLLTE